MKADVYAALPEATEQVLKAAIGCGIAVHRELGPGFTEKIYERAYSLEAAARGLRFEVEKPILVKYRHWSIPGQKVDLILEGLVLVELKVTPRLRSLHRSQVISYLKPPSDRLGGLCSRDPTHSSRRPQAGNPTGWSMGRLT